MFVRTGEHTAMLRELNVSPRFSSTRKFVVKLWVSPGEVKVKKTQRHKARSHTLSQHDLIVLDNVNSRLYNAALDHASGSWNTTRSLRNPVSAWGRRYARGLPRDHIPGKTCDDWELMKCPKAADVA